MLNVVAPSQEHNLIVNDFWSAKSLQTLIMVGHVKHSSLLIKNMSGKVKKFHDIDARGLRAVVAGRSHNVGLPIGNLNKAFLPLWLLAPPVPILSG